MVDIWSRERCGLAPPDTSRLTKRDPGALVGVTFHVTVTPASDPVHTWQRIQAEYMSGNNVNHVKYGDLPYNEGVTLDGRILQGRQHRYVGAHATSDNNVANRVTLGLAVIGTGAGLSHAAQQAIREWLHLLRVELGHAPVLFDHYDWRAAGGIATACPDPAVAAFVALLRAEQRAGH